MAETPHQTTIYPTNTIECRRNREQKRKITILYQSGCSNWQYKNHVTIFPIGPRRTQGNSRLSMVFSDATTHRLVARMDRPYPTTNCFPGSECSKSNICSTYPKCAETTTTTRPLLHGKSNYWKIRRLFRCRSLKSTKSIPSTC